MPSRKDIEGLEKKFEGKKIGHLVCPHGHHLEVDMYRHPETGNLYQILRGGNVFRVCEMPKEPTHGAVPFGDWMPLDEGFYDFNVIIPEDPEGRARHEAGRAEYYKRNPVT